MLTEAALFTSRYITMQAADNCLVEHTAVLFSPSSVPHYVVFYVQHKLGSRIWRKHIGCLSLPVFHWFWFIKRQHFLRLSSARTHFCKGGFSRKSTSRVKNLYSSPEVLLDIKEGQKKKMCVPFVFFLLGTEF